MEGLSNDVGDFWVGANVKILVNPTSSEFLRECVASYQPAIIRGLTSQWRATTEWNLSKICEKLEGSTQENRLLKVNVTPDGYGDCIKKVASANYVDDVDASSFNTFDGVTVAAFVYPVECMMPTSQFCDMMTCPEEGDAVPYLSLQNDNLRLEMPELLNDIAASFDIADEAFGQSQPEAVNLWIGDERSVSSLHKDHFENMYAVITGEKTFTLLPPTDILYLKEKEYSTMQYKIKMSCHSSKSASDCVIESNNQENGVPVIGRLKKSDLELTTAGCPSSSLMWIGTDPDDPDVLTEHPAFRYAHPIRCKIQPGEVLYIPAMWYHQVSQTKLTIAVNYWYDQKFDFRYCFYQAIKRLKEQISDDDDTEELKRLPPFKSLNV